MYPSDSLLSLSLLTSAVWYSIHLVLSKSKGGVDGADLLGCWNPATWWSPAAGTLCRLALVSSVLGIQSYASGKQWIRVWWIQLSAKFLASLEWNAGWDRGKGLW